MANGPNNSTSGTPSNPPSKGGRQLPPQHKVEVKDADLVQGQLVEGAHWLEDNSTIVISLIAIAIVVGVVYAIYNGFTKRQERVAQEAYYKVEAPFMKKRDAFEKTKFKAFMPPDQNDKTAGEVATGDVAKDYGPLLAGLESVAKDHSSTSAGGQAALLAGQTYLDYKNADKAIEFAQIPATHLSKDHTLATLGKILWGSALSSKGDCPAALKVWQEVLDTKSAEYLSNDVNLRMGTCLEKTGQNDRAAEAYRNASKGGETPAAQSAKGLLRSLELKAPSAASTAPAPIAPSANAPSGVAK